MNKTVLCSSKGDLRFFDLEAFIVAVDESCKNGGLPFFCVLLESQSNPMKM